MFGRPKKSKEQWYEEGYALGRLGRYEEALKAFEQAIRLDPYYADAYVGKCDAFRCLGRNEEAIRALEQALSLGLLNDI